MNKRHLRFLVVFVILCSAGLVRCHAATFDKIIVVVNGETITQAELDSAVEGAMARLNSSKGPARENLDMDKAQEKYKKEILDKMIEEKLILSEAKKKNIKVEDAEIEARLKEVQAQFGSEEKFKEVLKEEDFSLNELKKKYADQIMVSKLADAEIRKKTMAGPEEMLKYYESHKENFREPEQIRLKNILFKPQEGQSDENLKKVAEDVLASLRAGGNFDELALKYSKGPNPEGGGDLGYIKRGQLLKAIDEAVFNLKVGGLSDVIKTPVGHYIFKVEDKKPEKIKELKEVKNEIENVLLLQKMKKRYEQWIAELKKNAYISFR